MARSLRVEFPGAIYHVTVRMLGDASSRLFRDDADRKRFLARLEERVEQYNVRLYLFVLMRNHVHLVIETPEGNCSRFMQSLSTAYTVYYNLRHQRHGHLFDGRYKAKVVDGDDYLRALSRYVHLNPVHVGSIKRRPIDERVRYLRNYEWSSYPSYIKPRPTFSFVDSAPLLGTRGRSRREKQKQYREFVETGLAEEDTEIKAALTESPRSIGGEAFRITIDDMYRSVLESRRRPEDVAFRRVTEPLDPEVVLEALADEFGVPVEAFCERRRNSPLRALAAQALIRFSGQTQREIADRLGMTTGGAVSAQLRRLPDLLEDDRGLRRRVRRVERKLTESRRRGAED